MLVIKTKVIKIEDILKGTLAAEKRAADEKRKAQEQEDRTKQEDEVEKTPKSKEKGIKIPVPGKIKSFWGNIKKYIGTVLFGWLALQLLPLLPKLMPIVKFLASTADFIINIGGKILSGLVTFIDWGYKAVGATEKWIGDKFGEDAAEKFNSFTGFLTKTMNLVVALGMAAAAMGGGRQRGPNNKPRRKPRSLGDRARRMRRGFQTRAERATRSVRRFGRRIRPTNIKRFAQSKIGRLGKNITNLKQTGSKFLNRAKNIKPLDTLKRIIPKGQGGPGLFGRMKSGAGNLWKGTKQLGGKAVNVTKTAGKNIVKVSNKALKGINTFAKNQLANVDNIIGGIKAQGAKWAKKIGGALDKMNPMKLGEKVKGLLKGKMDKIVKNNDLIKQIKNLNVKDAAKNIKKLLEGAKKNKNILKIRQGLKAAKAAKIGGVDAVIAAIMGVLDYAAFGESPINAILRAIGGLLGYTAGFAIGAPFGGAPGFITGMAGAFVGEFASKMIAKGLAKT